jgi:hypothetical protein
MRFLWFAPVFLAVNLAACSGAGRRAAWETPADDPPRGLGTSTVSASVLSSAAEEAWKKRDDKAAVQRAIAGWQQKIAADPKDADALLALSRAYYFLADAHLSLEAGENEKEELLTYEKGVNAGEKALMALDPQFDAELRAGAEFKDVVGKISARGAPAAFWYCANLGKFASRKGLKAVFFYKDRIQAAMARVIELDEQYYYGAPLRLLGSLYAVLPTIAGKDLQKSKEYFDRSSALAPQYLSTRVLEAQFLAVELEDRDMFQRILKDVLASPDEVGDFGPENRAAKRTAEKLLREIDDKF